MNILYHIMKQYTEGDVQAALEAISAGAGARETSSDFGIPRSTLFGRREGSVSLRELYVYRALKREMIKDGRHSTPIYILFLLKIQSRRYNDKPTTANHQAAIRLKNIFKECLANIRPMLRLYPDCESWTRDALETYAYLWRQATIHLPKGNNS